MKSFLHFGKHDVVQKKLLAGPERISDNFFRMYLRGQVKKVGSTAWALIPCGIDPGPATDPNETDRVHNRKLSCLDKKDGSAGKISGPSLMTRRFLNPPPP